MQPHPSPRTDIQQSTGQKAILEAAAQLFSQYGFDRVSMRQIAGEAGVSKANIYHHYQSKNELYLAILRESAQHLSEMVEALAQGEGDFEQRLRVFTGAHLDHLFADSATVKLVIREAFSGDEEKGRLVAEQVVGGIFDRMVAIFQAGQASGVLRAELDPALCASLLIGGNLFFFQAYDVFRQIPEAGFARDRQGFSRQMANVLLRGMLSEEHQRRTSR
jgi:TetR/AcrR family transcriptional regulator